MKIIRQYWLDPQGIHPRETRRRAAEILAVLHNRKYGDPPLKISPTDADAAQLALDASWRQGITIKSFPVITNGN